MGTSTDELRRIVADSDLETRPDSLLPDDYLDRAEQQAEADTQPAPGQDDRPSQVAAFNTIEEIAPALYRPAHRLRALQMIDSLDHERLAFDGYVEDLLCPERRRDPRKRPVQRRAADHHLRPRHGRGTGTWVQAHRTDQLRSSAGSRSGPRRSTTTVNG